MSLITELALKLRSIWPLLDERTRRIMAANEAIGLGYGGVSVVRRACGLSRKAITNGIREIQKGDCPAEGRIRRAGGGRKSLTVTDHLPCHTIALQRRAVAPITTQWGFRYPQGSADAFAPTDPPVYGRACPSQGLPQPGSAMTTRHNHSLPRQDLHLQACQR